MAEVAAPGFSEDLKGLTPILSISDFSDFVHSDLVGSLPEIQKNAINLFSKTCSAIGRSTDDKLSFYDIGPPAEEECARRWLSWATCSGEPMFHYIRRYDHDIPNGILPDSFHEPRLTDFRIFTGSPPGQPRRKGPMTDDNLYAEHKELRDKLARGNCFLEYTTHSTTGSEEEPVCRTERHQACVVFGLRKFTGGLGDEDDDLTDDSEVSEADTSAVSGQVPRWANFFSSPLSEVKSFVATSKANGEAAHFAVRYVHNQWLMFAGSKNVHIVFRKRSDLQEYKNGSYNIAQVVAKAVCDMLDAMDSRQRHMCLSFLASTGLTAIFELLQPCYQHVECLNYLMRPRLDFICWSSFMDSMNDVCVGALDPMLCHHLAKAFGLTPVECQDLPLEDLDAYLTKIRTDYGREGDVLYFLDGERKAVGLLKRKTVWYVCVRAIREKAKSTLSRLARLKKDDKAKAPQAPSKRPSELPLVQGALQRVRNRFQQISEWLEFGEECRQQWETLGIQFITYLVDKVHDGSIQRETVISTFPIVWNQFLDESGNTDRIPVDTPPCTAASSVFGAT